MFCVNMLLGEQTLFWVVVSNSFFTPGEVIQFDEYCSTGLKSPTSISFVQCIAVKQFDLFTLIISHVSSPCPAYI